MWLKTADQKSAGEVAATIERYLADIKCETASTAVSRFLEPFSNLLWFVKHLLVPAILVCITVIVAIAIGITVRERRLEIAVLKVLGYRAGQILVLVLGEALFLGALSGAVGSGLSYVLMNHVIGGIKIPIGFFPVFFIPTQALWWGPAVGAGAALLGSALPAWTARAVKVSEVFAKVA
jgi:putative ABC transport system permease protein